MQKNRILFFIVCCMSGALFLSGCGFQKEVVLEHSGYELSAELLSEKQAESDLSKVTAAEATEAEDLIYVYICGQVKKPGVYQVHADDRVFVAIELAGGLTEEADVSGVNQAQKLSDGQMIYVPAEGESVSSLENGTSQIAQEALNAGLVNINTADLEGLMSLPGIGEGKAQSILQYRQEHGSFQSIDEIMNVNGIKEGIYKKFKDKITV